MENVSHYLLRKLKTADTAIFFDRYYDFSIKSSMRLNRESSSSMTHKLTLTSPLPAKMKLKITADQSHMRELVLMTTIINESHSLVATDSAPAPIEVKNNGVAINRDDLKTTQEEADLILEQQAYQYVLDNWTSTVSVISENTGAFVLLAYFYWNLNLKNKIFLEATEDDRTLIDIANTMVENMNTDCTKSCTSSFSVR